MVNKHKAKTVFEAKASKTVFALQKNNKFKKNSIYHLESFYNL